MKIYIGADHGAFKLKEILREYLSSKKACPRQGSRIEIIDCGTFSEESVDYPDIAKLVSEKVLKDKNSFGILMCGTGIGISMSANKIKGIRAALCANEYMARMARLHNDANVLCIGGRVIGDELAKSIVDAFMVTDFSFEERHKKRIEKINQI
jgi:ribose 5-phosphate isomerase B